MKRKKKEMEFQARCLGAEIKEEIEVQELTPEQIALVKKSSQERMSQRGLKPWQTQT